MRVVDHSPGHQLGRARIVAVAAATGLVVTLVCAASTGARQVLSGTSSTAKAGAAATSTPITPAHGPKFVPQLGDWEGSVNGFPVSFELLSVPRFQTQRHLPPYGYTDIVALEPSGCPPSAGHYSEDSIAVGHAVAFGGRGGFSLTPVGFGGGLQGARSAVLDTTFRPSPGCSGRLVWHLHPANRGAVPDSRWKVRFSDGESSTFRVKDGGRLATKIRLPQGLARCGGPLGAVDVFIGARGNAAVVQAKLNMGLHFSGPTAKGKVAVPGASCHRPSLKLTAAPG